MSWRRVLSILLLLGTSASALALARTPLVWSNNSWGSAVWGQAPEPTAVPTLSFSGLALLLLAMALVTAWRGVQPSRSRDGSP